MESENQDSNAPSEASVQEDQSHQGKLDADQLDVITALRAELAEMKERLGKIDHSLGIEKGEKAAMMEPTIQAPFPANMPVPENFGMRSPSAAVVSLQQQQQQPMGTKGAPPGGMTAEQLQDFKKMTLQINAMQQKIKDLENKLTETVTGIKKGTERADEMEEKGTETIKDIYKCIDQINNSLSEKIAQQKVEVQKIAGDTPKPINYDPFNYGEAYGGDVVDFQARRRIIEIKLLLQGLQASMNQLRDSVRVSPSIDLGYKVVRLDQLIASSGFGRAIQKGEATHEDALVVSNSKTREPGRVDYPKKEIFQVAEDMESSWAITDSIMQTMYRLEMELGELQKVVGSSDLSGNTKLLEDLQTSIKHVKDKAIDMKTVKRLIEEAIINKVPHAPYEKKNQIVDSAGSNALVATASKAKFDQQIKNLSMNITSIDQRMAKIEAHIEKRPKSAVLKGVLKERACLSCDREVDLPREIIDTTLPEVGFFNPTWPRDPKFIQQPTKIRFVLARSYDIETGKDKTDVYSIPRPVGAGYAQYWPVPSQHCKYGFKTMDERKILATDCVFIQGYDGRLYKADRGSLKLPEMVKTAEKKK